MTTTVRTYGKWHIYVLVASLVITYVFTILKCIQFFLNMYKTTLVRQLGRKWWWKQYDMETKMTATQHGWWELHETDKVLLCSFEFFFIFQIRASITRFWVLILLETEKGSRCRKSFKWILFVCKCYEILSTIL